MLNTFFLSEQGVKEMEIMELMDLGGSLLQTTIAVGGAIDKLSPHRQCIVEITNHTKCYILQNPG